MTPPTPDDWRALRAALSPGALVTDPVELITYEIDAGLDRGRPQAAVFPRSLEDVVTVVRWAAAHDLPLVARGAGTGLSGGAVPSQGGLILSFSRMDRVLEFDEVGRLVVVQPGVVNEDLDEMVKTGGLYYPPDPSSGRSATMGGNIAENAGGPHCFKYGVTTNYVTGLQVVLADGQVMRTGGPAYDYPEYDFTGLLTGSEGTLAVIVEASLRLTRNPQGVKTMTACFDSLEAAGDAVSAIIARQLVPATMEMMDRNVLGIVEAYIHAGLPTDATAMLIVETDGYQESLDAQTEEIAAILRERQGRDLRVARTDAEREQLWYGRKSAAGAMARISPARYPADIAVPRSKLAEMIAGVNRICAAHDLRVGYLFHAGDGNLHPSIFFDPRDGDMVQRMHQAVREVMELCVQKGGSITGEHGVGLEKQPFMALMFTPGELAAMREVKDIFDPHKLLNPGKIFPPEGGPEESRLPASRGEVTPPLLSGRSTPLPARLVPQSDEEAADGLRAAQVARRPLVIRGGGSQDSRGGPDRFSPAHAAQPGRAETRQVSGPRTSDTPLTDSPGLSEESSPIVLSTEKLAGIVDYAPRDLYVTARAGTRLADLQAALAPDGLWVPLVSPWAASTLGGLISTSLNGPQRMRYGAVRDMLLGARVILPDGRRLRFGRPLVKNVAGYDMVKLFVGAHGTLGLISEVTLRLSPLPRARASLLAGVDDLRLGLALGRSLLRLSYVASAVLLCQGCPTPPGVSPGRYLLAFSAEGHPQDVQAELRLARAALAAGGAGSVAETDTMVGADLWAGLLRAGSGCTVRIGLPPKDLLAYLEANAVALDGDACIADFAGGTIHARLAATHIPALRQAALALGGYAAVTSGAAGLDPWGYTPDTLPLMRRLKARWDPAGCLNPGAFLV
jgi:glycolate oxidase subunit GlcD